MDAKVKAILAELQNGIKLESSPFKRIAKKIGITEDEVVEVIKEYIENKTIRRLGAAVRPDKLEYVNNALVAWKVSDERVQAVGETLAGFKEITHCYDRECPDGWDYNFFTMIHAKTEEDLQKVISRISTECNLSEYSIFRTIKELKKTSMKYFE